MPRVAEVRTGRTIGMWGCHVARPWGHAALHDHMAPQLRRMLRRVPQLVVTLIPFRL
ncbi:hypothetical protein [Catenulispora subtropica]|uniref:Uncharacterized protein n=1 Tax=Catenulispora subtropica TaxID=450798 RepID=A0ABN2SQ97_9ACTN